MAPGPGAPTGVNPALSGRIQGYGNFNPPPLEEDNAKTMTKKVVNNVGEMLGEEISLTMQDFKEKGAVGAVKDAVVDAGDILIDGAASVIGWLRGDPPPEDDEDTAQKAEDASKVLEHGPNGAAYGIQQASPTGGINAVWVMPEDADPAMLAEVAKQSPQRSSSSSTPPGIQPYAPNGVPASPFQPMPGGPVIAPYQPEPKPGTAGQPKFPGFVPGMLPGAKVPAGVGAYGGGAGMPGAAAAGGYAPGSSSPGAGSSLSGAKRLVEQVSKGELIPGPEVAKRLMTTCAAAKLTAKQLSEVVCERARRLYLGLDSSVSDTDAGLMRLMKLTDALHQLGSGMARDSVKEITEGVKEEFTSLQSNATYRSEATACLQSLGMSKAPPAEMADLLGEDTKPAAAGASVDLLGGGASSSAGADLLDMGEPAKKPAPAASSGGTANLLDF